MGKLLKYSIFFASAVLLWVIIWPSSAIIGSHDSNSYFFPPDSSATDDTNTRETDSKLKFPFSDVNRFETPGSGSSSPLYLSDPKNVSTDIEYNPKTGEYEFSNKIGNMNYRYPSSMTLDEYKNYDFDRAIDDYWRQKAKSESFTHQKTLLPKLHIGNEVFDRIFGSSTIDIKPQGSAELIFGLNISKIDNPQLSERLRKTWTFDFQEKIQMNVTGQIGDKLKLSTNYNTEASFDFENKMKLAYEGKEDEIIQKVEAGDVTLPLTGSLITGSQSLFGIKTELQFGKLTATTVFSQQKGKTSVIEIEGGAQTNYFEVNCDDYEANKHFFLAQYFRDNYNKALENLPVVQSDINITKIEVWVTNKTGNYEESRNVLAFLDLGEGKNATGDNNVFAQNIINMSYGGFPRNESNNIYEALIDARPELRNFNDITASLTDLQSSGYRGGQDYEKIESARLLSPSEYKLNSRLGFVSLNSALNADEILAVAYEYTTSDGKIYRVGELTSDGVSAPQTLMVKLIKGTSLTPKLPNWKLMMKNVYALGAYQVSSDEFYLNVLYNDPKTGTPINYLPESDIFAGKPLLEVMNLDNLNSQLDPFPDGIFDFIDGYTINASNGRVYFPVLEPFGKDLEKEFGPGNEDRADNYTFRELYDSTQSIARQIAEKNKFVLKGSYQSSAGSDISLNAFNVPQGSVVVTAGGRQLVENVDYTVDYTLGRVKIINQGLLESGTPIKISLENNALFSIQSKTLIGTHLNYRVNNDLNIGATILNLTERPLTQKVNIGDEPISNTIWGVDGTWRTDAPFLTKLVDRLPFLETKEKSTITATAEFAHLIPGHSRAIEKEGVAYIDDFEGSKTSLDIKSNSAWKLASTPQGQPAMFKGGDKLNTLDYGYHRAKIGWYTVDPILVRKESGTPKNIDKDEQSNHYVREIYEKEIFPNKETPNGIPTNIPVLNVVFNPAEKGPYNYNFTDIDSSGNFREPEDQWGGIMRKIETNDFEAANIEYIEFWLMDPFLDPDGPGSTGGPLEPINNTGGYLYFNLGNISEDILNDGRKTFENGLPTSSTVELIDTTVWGRVPLKQSMVNAFDNKPESRQYQDLGLDGLSDEDERSFFSGYHNYLDTLKSIFGAGSEAYTKAYQDPSNDNFHYFRGTDYDNDEKFSSILERYQKYNGLEGNSPTSEMSPEDYPTQGTSIPDVEDINRDNNLSESESYFQYRIPIYPGMDVGNGYITDKITKTPDLPNEKNWPTTWYQFKIPVQSPDTVIGSILDFKSIRFVRMLLHGFSESVVLRFATLDLVRGEWRKYQYSLRESGEWVPDDGKSGGFNISAVNLEENGEKSPVNYVLPPNISRVYDPSNPYMTRMNEQSIVLQAIDLIDGDAKAAYKNVDLDVRQYKKLQMEVHAEAIEEGTLADGDMRVFIRLGADYKQNYYEYEIPLVLTPAKPPEGYNDENEDDKKTVWPEINRFDFEFTVLQKIKQLRNSEARKEGSLVASGGYMEMWEGNRRISIKGHPNLSDIRTIMIGIRNPKQTNNPFTDDALAKSVEVWLNELRLTDFDEEGGWAANARVAARLADFGTLNLAGSTSRRGFGSIEKKVNERSQEDVYQYDVSSNLELGKFFPEKARISIPMYLGYSENFVNPEYNPLDPDIPLELSLEELSDLEKSGEITKDSIKAFKKAAQTYTKRKSMNFTNVRINNASSKPKIWSPSNLGVNYGYNILESRDITTSHNLEKRYNGGIMYNFNTNPKSISPFKKATFLKSEWLRLIRDFNFNPVPNQLSFSTDLNRNYRETKLRDISAADIKVDIPVTVKKDFGWNRIYNVKYDLTKALKLDYNATNMARIDEPPGRVFREPDDIYDPNYDTISYDVWKDSVVKNLSNLGRNTSFRQSFNANYTLPINKIPIFSWITSTVRYSGNYDWLAGPIALDDSLDVGNTIKNSSTIQLNGQMNFLNLYNKSKYLKKVNDKYNRSGRGKKAPKKPDPNKDTEKVRFPEKGRKEIRLKADVAKYITHKLMTEDVQVKVFDDKGKPIKGEVKIINENKISFKADKDYPKAAVEITGTRPIKRSIVKEVVERSLAVMMGVKNLSVTWSQTDGSVLPGYKYETRFFGLNDKMAPGFPYAFGYSDEDFGIYAGNNQWIIQSGAIYEPFRFNHSENFNLRSSIEPVSGMRIDVNATRNITSGITEYIVYDPETEEWTRQNQLISGNFSMSFNTMNSAFKSISNEDYSSEVFNDFKEYRKIISARLADERSADPGDLNPNMQDASGYRQGYGSTSQQVMIPAFIAAYTGRDPQDVSTSEIPSLVETRNGKLRLNVMPNWRISYDGLKNVAFLKKYLKTITLTHAYRSTYSIGSFNTNSFYASMYDSVGYSNLYDIEDNYLPEFDINSLSISEQFSPLIDIDMTWKNSLISKVEIKRTRNMSLSFSNNWMTETSSNEYIFGGGYRIKNVPILINDRKFESDVNVRADLSIRNNLTVIRKIEEDLDELTAGSSVITIKLSADYVLSDRFNLKIFYDRVVNKPKISLTYPRANTNFGVSIRFTLAQ